MTEAHPDNPPLENGEYYIQLGDQWVSWVKSVTESCGMYPPVPGFEMSSELLKFSINPELGQLVLLPRKDVYANPMRVHPVTRHYEEVSEAIAITEISQQPVKLDYVLASVPRSPGEPLQLIGFGPFEYREDDTDAGIVTIRMRYVFSPEENQILIVQNDNKYQSS